MTRIAAVRLHLRQDITQAREFGLREKTVPAAGRRVDAAAGMGCRLAADVAKVHIDHQSLDIPASYVGDFHSAEARLDVARDPDLIDLKCRGFFQRRALRRVEIAETGHGQLLSTLEFGQLGVTT